MLRSTRKLKGTRLLKKQQGGSDEIFDKITIFFQEAREYVMETDEHIHSIQRQLGTSNGTSNISIKESLIMLNKTRGGRLGIFRHTAIRGKILLRGLISGESHQAEQVRYDYLIRKLDALLFLIKKIQSVLDSATSHSATQSLQRNTRATLRNNRDNRWYTTLGKKFKKSVKSIHNSIKDYFRRDDTTGHDVPYYRDAIGNYDIMKDEFVRDPDFDS